MNRLLHNWPGRLVFEAGKRQPDGCYWQQAETKQASVKEEIAAGQINIDYHYDFINVINGFSATAAVSDVQKLRQLPG
jgi:hypothetical protein